MALGSSDTSVFFEDTFTVHDDCHIGQIHNAGRIEQIETSGDNVRVVNSGRIGRGGAEDGITFQGDNVILELRRGTLIQGDISFRGAGTRTLEIDDLGEVN